MKEDRDFDFEIGDYDSETDTYLINFNLSDEELDDIKNDYEQYLDAKENIEDALSFDDFFETALHIGLYSRQLSIKKTIF